ncbi:hypothetical protein [Fulvivirga lutimaris]|uniref:hypothetical protein n=1 Tax=Fulvivirga lutimaris TaxID=1819566 RepID=UPI0012BCF797|nr:hypothetical protein [Fulvivirga lutimaris]MTI40952.1 hypothetical protein [Fulvivirga lutimaris]
MKLFKHEKLVITKEEINGVEFIKEVWSGVLSTTIFHKLVLESLKIYREQVPLIKGDSKRFLLFADVSKLEIISAKDIQWLIDEVNLEYEKLGFTEQAVIVPKSQIAQTTVSEYEGVTGSFNTKLFSEELTALRWFLSLL